MDKQVERKEWLFFADSFSEENNGRSVTIESVSQDMGDETLAEKTALIALDFDDKESPGAAMITVGKGTETFTHILEAPDAVWFERLGFGKIAAMEVVAANGDRLIIRFDDV